jgi:RNA polymerase sigma-32 factor
MDNWRLVKIGTTQTQRKLFYNLIKERQRLQSLGFDPTVSNLSKSLGVAPEEIEEMEQRLAKSDMSLDVTFGEDSTTTRLDFLPSLGPGVEDIMADDEIAGIIDATSQASPQAEREGARHPGAAAPVRLPRDPARDRREVRHHPRACAPDRGRLLEKIKDHLSDKIEDFSPDWIRRKR